MFNSLINALKKRAERVQQNLSFIANPKTRETWFKGFTPVSSPVQKVQSNITSWATKHPQQATKITNFRPTEEIPYMNKSFTMPKIPVVSQATKLVFAPTAQTVQKAYPSFQKMIAPLQYGRPKLTDVGNLAGAAGAVTTPGSNIIGGAFGTGMQAVGNIFQKKPITKDLYEGYRQGFEFQTKLGPLSSLAGTALSPLLRQINPAGATAINTYIKIAKNAPTPQAKKKALDLAWKAFKRQVGEKAIRGFASMGSLGATRPAKNWEERLKNIFHEGIIGAGFEVGMYGLGQAGEIGLKQGIKPLWKKYQKMPNKEAGFIKWKGSEKLSHEKYKRKIKEKLTQEYIDLINNEKEIKKGLQGESSYYNKTTPLYKYRNAMFNDKKRLLKEFMKNPDKFIEKYELLPPKTSTIKNEYITPKNPEEYLSAESALKGQYLYVKDMKKRKLHIIPNKYKNIISKLDRDLKNYHVESGQVYQSLNPKIKGFKISKPVDESFIKKLQQDTKIGAKINKDKSLISLVTNKIHSLKGKVFEIQKDEEGFTTILSDKARIAIKEYPDNIEIVGIKRGKKALKGEPTQILNEIKEYAKRQGKAITATEIVGDNINYWKKVGFEPIDISKNKTGWEAIWQPKELEPKTKIGEVGKPIETGIAGKKIQAERIITQSPQTDFEKPVVTTAKSPRGIKPNKAKSIIDSIPPKDKIPLKHIIDENTPDVKKKVNILDYLATPKYVLEKIGLGKEAEMLDRAQNTYKAQVRSEIKKISSWREQLPNKQSSQNIFKWLDGQKVTLNSEELKMAKQIKSYLADWADKLKLPKDKRITHYITHIFDRDLIKKEFDPELAKIIANRPAGSVYDPFLLKRLGKLGYKEDVWAALSAYVKRATRKYNMDPALKELAKKAKSQPLENLNYITNLTHRINLRPTEIDNLLDNLIKQSPVGYKLGQRPTTVATRALRQQIYRGGLGFNIGSAVKNLSQGINTYAELGEKYTAKGYWDLITKGTKELFDNGVLEDSFIEDKSLPVYKSLLNKLDKGLFYLFEQAEKINRGSAYYGAKAKALNKGMSEQQAINYAKNIVAKTQFKFGGVHTPVAMGSDLAKTLLQFQTYGIKQAEFLGGKIKNKEFASLARYILGTLAVYATIGKALGWRIQDISIPSFRFSSPTTSIAGSIYKFISAGNDKRKQAEARRELLKSGSLLIPGGVQAKKTTEGLGNVYRGYAKTPSGNVKYPVEQNLQNYLKGTLFGQYSLPESRDYYKNKRSPLGKNQSEFIKKSENPKKAVSIIYLQRENEKERTQAKEYLQTGQSLEGIKPRNQAMAMYQILKSTPKEERKTKYLELAQNIDPQTEEELKVIIDLSKRGLSTRDMDLMLVPKEMRAASIIDRLKALDKKNRKKKYLQLVKEGIITPDIELVIARMLKK